MRSLVLVSVLFVGISFYLQSQQETHGFYYKIPAPNSEVNFNLNTDACGGYVAKDFSDTFHVQNVNESESSDKSYKDTYYAFDLAWDSENNV